MLNKKNFKQNYISPEKFDFYCQTGTEYEGFVVGKGYAWVWDGAVFPLDYAPKDVRLKYKTDTPIRYVVQMLDISDKCIEQSYNNGGGWIIREDKTVIWDSRVNNDAQAKKYWGKNARYLKPYSTADVYVKVEEIINGRREKKEKLIKNALLEATNKIVKDGVGYIVEDMKGKEPWHTQAINRANDAVNLAYALWLYRCEQLGEHIIFEVNGNVTAGNKFGVKFGVVNVSGDIGSVEIAKGKIDLINPTKSAWGENYEPYKATTGVEVGVGLGRNSGLSIGVGYEESWEYTKMGNGNRYLSKPKNPDEVQKELRVGTPLSRNKNFNNEFELEAKNGNLNVVKIPLKDNKNTKVKEEHAIEIGWMVALFWSFGINVRIGYKTEVEK
ncbi:hypothetical protein [Capnocytophaga cynodegmi]|uniref:hypothetical protein n=1 Tax=Capnocytophaga cynodegmi TaxID=28189 RepID=UPI00385AF891